MKTIANCLCIAALLLAAPVYFVWDQLVIRDESLAQGKMIVEFWCPDDATVVTDSKEWLQEWVKHEGNLILQAHLSVYKKELKDEKHLILFTNGLVRYQAHQGKVLVWSEGGTSKIATDRVKAITYLGNGKVALELEATSSGFWHSIFYGIFLGATVDGTALGLFYSLLLLSTAFWMAWRKLIANLFGKKT